MSQPKPDYKELVDHLVEYFVSLPLNTEVTIFDLLEHAGCMTYGNRWVEYQNYVKIWSLYDDFMRECRKRKILIDQHNYYGQPVGLPYNFSFWRVDKHVPSPEEVIMKKALTVFAKYPIEKETTIFDLIKEACGEEEAFKILKLNEDYKYTFYLPQKLKGYVIRTNNDVACFDGINIRTPIRKTLQPLIKFRLLAGDITSDKILKGHDLIVNPTNPAMVCGGGVSGAIFHKAGVDELEKYTQDTFDIHYLCKNYKEENLMKVGDIRITPGFKLGMDIMFVQGPKKWEYEQPTDTIYYHTERLEVLMEVYKKLLNMAYEKGYRNILLPALGTGSYGFTHKETGPLVTKLLFEFVRDKDVRVDFVIQDRKDRCYYLGLKLNKITEV